MRRGDSTGRGDALSVVLAQSTLLLSSLAVQALLAWLLMPAGRGQYAVFAVLGALMPVLCSFGVDRSIQYQLMSGRMTAGAAMGSMLVAALISALLGTGVGLLLAGRGPFPAFAAAPASWYAALVLIALTSGYTYLLRLLVATRRFRQYLVVTIVQGAANVVLLVSLVGVLRLGTAGAVAAFALSYGVGASLSLYWLRAAGDRMTIAPRAQLPAIAGYAAQYYPALLGHAIDFNAGTLVLASIAASSEVGLYAAISALMLRFLLFAQALQETVLPRVAADSIGRPALVAQMSRISMAGTALIAVAFCLVSKPVLSLLLSPAFARAAVLAWWIAPGLILHAASTLLMPYFEGTNRPGAVSIATWIGLLGNIMSIVGFYPLLGLQGAALALSIGMSLRFAVLAWLFCRSTRTPLKDITFARPADVRLLKRALPLWRPGIRGT